MSSGPAADSSAGPLLVRAIGTVAVPVLAALTLFFAVVAFVDDGMLGIDFRQVAPEIRGLVHGTSPYVSEGMQAGGHFLWSVLAGWLLMPFAWLPSGWIAVSLLGLAAVPLTLWLLGVRDWRLWMLALAWPATWYGFRTANITMLVVVLIALGWHERRRDRAGLWLGLAVAVKLFAWPVLVWLAATRRWRALAVATAVQAVALLITLPYHSLADFARYQREADRVFSDEALTPYALLLRWDVPGARAVAVVLGLALLVWGRRDLGWCVVAALVLSPILWLHYFGLLMIPLALWAAPFWAWLLPFGLWIAPPAGDPSQWRLAATLGVFAACAAGAYASPRRPDVPRPAPARGWT